MDSWAFNQFSKDPIRFLDARFGEGTGEACRHAGQDRVAMRFDPFRGIDMALPSYLTGTTTSGTSTTEAVNTVYDSWIMDHIKEERIYKKFDKAINKKQTHESISFKKKLVRNLPFVEGGDGLVKTLQREFDHWAKPQLEIMRG